MGGQGDRGAFVQNKTGNVSERTLPECDVDLVGLGRPRRRDHDHKTPDRNCRDSGQIADDHYFA